VTRNIPFSPSITHEAANLFHHIQLIVMKITSTSNSRRFGLRLVSSTRALLAVSALAALAVPTRSFAQTPTQTDIGNLGGGSTNVAAVAGDYVVGQSIVAAQTPWGGALNHAYVWSASTKAMVDIGALLPNSGAISGATSVNSKGQVAGFYFSPAYDGTVYGFFWDPTTGVKTVGQIVWGNNGASILINESGVVASVDTSGNVFRWTLGGGIENLGTTGYDAYGANGFSGGTTVTGINAHGDIVGNSGSGSAGFGVSFFADGSASTLTLLTSPGDSVYPSISVQNQGGLEINVSAINDSGVVVGTYWDVSYLWEGYAISQGGFFNAGVHNSHAFKWSQAGGFTDLGNLGVSYLVPGAPATFAASALAINNSGTIVGYGFPPTGGYAPFVYGPGSGLTQLPGLYSGDNEASATGINNDGVVVGYANGTAAAVMWKNGVVTNLTPSFANQWPGAPFINGSRIAGNGGDQNGFGHGWTFALASTTPPPPVVTSASVSAGYGSAFSYTISATNSPTGYGATNLPSGLALTGNMISGTLPNTLGTSIIDLSATNAGGTGTGTLTLTIVDPAPPTIASLTPSTASIWPPNKKMVPITLSAGGANLSKNVVFKITSVTTNEPDGKTQWQITGPLTLNLLADRLGTGTGRIYTITVVATDAAGSSSTMTCIVTVPHDQGK
jgi:probable HAF family extracellular repeat protein